MKKIYLLPILVLSFLIQGCFSGDDYSDRTVYLRINDAISIVNRENYVVGDTIVFELKFSRYLPEEGYDNLLDIYESTGSEEFGYSFGMSKFSDFSNRFENIFVDRNFVLGSRVSDDIFLYNSGSMAAILEDNQQVYSSKVGIILVETGTFKLDLDPIGIESPYYYDRFKGIHISIEHAFSAESSENTQFTVTE